MTALEQSSFEAVRWSNAAGVTIVELCRPHRHNAMTGQMACELAELLVALEDHEETRVILLTGAGDSFCPGGDLDDLAAGDGWIADRHDRRDGFRVPVLLHRHRAVTVAAINGPCAGAGLGWAAACDLRYASVGARFTTAFLDLGVSGDMGGPWTLSRLIGGARTRSMYFRPGVFDADHAVSIGLVEAVFPSDEIRAEVTRICEAIANHPPAALSSMKANFVDAERLDLASYCEVETDRIFALLGTDEARSRFAAASRRVRGDARS